ncbi:uncharacterized protein EV420DRAFT_1683095 [Desarmillaria tabescens]|uniref:HNH nuclease domain-containing protein n=1 Tax=Armillaria tabescens TaxID=1929756 RepID=A0AA39N4U6_ARMTA|nr:uncharacterized protein EV420DRAFT_1683095 [Desarmillaria tabescens]KAK0457937.1 hypothetical protein EV420DRAFT_1683095 [Desarmillaria tabescens]
MPAVALPPVTILDDLNTNGIRAYNICLELEKSAPADSDTLIHARTLGYLIIHSPSHTALQEVANAIHSCARDHAKLSHLGQCFINYFIRPFKKFKGRTPASSDNPSCQSSCDKLKRDLIQEAPKTHKEAKDLALVRDGFRCVVTGNYHHDTLSQVSASANEIREAGVVYTQCAHIALESTYFNLSDLDSSNEEPDYAALVKVHPLYNVMTMQSDIHEWFTRLEIRFEKTEVTNRYRIRSIDAWYRLPAEVTFTTPDDENLPVPSESLLALHAVCAKVANFSGAAEYIDKLDQEVEDLGVLAHDGSSGDVLSSALLKSMNQAVGVGH